ncbi:putative olfactory receptor 13C6 [Lontra canadensis]|uniref:putative olfactory receptor 13C6 n=1 Tax=Lontra canadensis TaxID=76717 RepID=UPI0013F2F263|nr:putative olfactory receptor 13C6 [Lontra canadensis]
MRRDNLTCEFVLLGLSSDRQTQAGLFVLFGAAYLLTLLGNGLIVLLHLPMYFFLCNHLVVDICYTSSGVPQMLVHFLLEKKTISFTQCGTQLFFSGALGSNEFLLLAAMAYDCYMAIGDHLCYMEAVSCLINLVTSMVETVVTMCLHTWGHHVLNHVACECHTHTVVMVAPVLWCWWGPELNAGRKLVVLTEKYRQAEKGKEKAAS